MKKTLLIISILILGLITSCFIGIIVYHNKYCRDREDRAVADTIPRYPEASSWKIGDSTNQCLADGTPSAYIYFNSDRKLEEVLTFYKEELPKHGWVLVSTPSQPSYSYDGAGNKIWKAPTTGTYDHWEKSYGNSAARFTLGSASSRAGNYLIEIWGLHPYYFNRLR